MNLVDWSEGKHTEESDAEKPVWKEQGALLLGNQPGPPEKGGACVAG